eukprot:6213251-Pleurochrysis_carterae.AAC.1
MERTCGHVQAIKKVKKTSLEAADDALEEGGATGADTAAVAEEDARDDEPPPAEIPPEVDVEAKSKKITAASSPSTACRRTTAPKCATLLSALHVAKPGWPSYLGSSQESKRESARSPRRLNRPMSLPASLASPSGTRSAEPEPGFAELSDVVSDDESDLSCAFSVSSDSEDLDDAADAEGGAGGEERRKGAYGAAGKSSEEHMEEKEERCKRQR